MSTVEGLRERSYSWDDPRAVWQQAAGLSGLECITAIVEGRLPVPPFARTLDLEIVAAEHGRVVFATEPAEWMFNPLGSVHGGIAATLMDSCMGCAVHTTLEVGTSYVTTDLHTRYLRGMSDATGRVLAEGLLEHRGRRTATATARMWREADDKLIATGTAAFAVLA
jgi:uncharacterized protein (TIGR00369 family)